jgi:alanine racemase
MAVSRAGIGFDDLLLLTPLSETDKIIALARIGVSFTVSSSFDAQILKNLWYITGKRPRAHIKIDTGMGRRGFFPEQTREICRMYSNCPEIEFIGIYSHFCCGCNAKLVKKQFGLFSRVLKELSDAGIDPGIRHISASSALFHHPEMNLDAVRVGSAIFGRIAQAESFGLQATGHCSVPIEQIRELPAGMSVGYGAGYKANKAIRAATCQIGTHYGFALAKNEGERTLLGELRSFARIFKERFVRKNIPFAIIGGIKCPVLGAVGSESVTLDVTDIDCKRGDEAEFDINPMLLSCMDVELE